MLCDNVVFERYLRISWTTRGQFGGAKIFANGLG
jgi:hypothetical protein